MSDTSNNVNLTKQAYDQIHKSVINPTIYKDVRNNLDRFISYLPGKKVLDVGCANGYESEYLYGRGLDVTGCDISEKFVHTAQARLPKCRFFQVDMRYLDSKVEPNMFDGIWANASFLHIPKKDALQTLQALHKALKDGGIVYVSVMRGDYDGLRDNKNMGWPERHFSDYHPEELQKLLTQVGFETIGDNFTDTDWGPSFLHFFCKKVNVRSLRR